MAINKTGCSLYGVKRRADGLSSAAISNRKNALKLMSSVIRCNNARHQLKSIFSVPDLLPNTMYLGHPLIFSHRDKNRAYNFIYNKFFAKLGTLKANKLNHAGRLQYIKSVLSSIPIYYMSTVLFSKTFIKKINTIIKRFWWIGVQEE
jgi:hypothetical protein